MFKMIIYDPNGDTSEQINPIGVEKPPAGKVPKDVGNKPIAYIIDEDVVETTVANSNYSEILFSDFQVEDVTDQYEDIDSEQAYVLKFIVDGEEKLTVATLKRYGAIMLSNPKIVEITQEFRAVEPGWKYADGTFFMPEDFDPYSDEIY
jgi:hypothetical protein